MIGRSFPSPTTRFKQPVGIKMEYTRIYIAYHVQIDPTSSGKITLVLLTDLHRKRTFFNPQAIFVCLGVFGHRQASKRSKKGLTFLKSTLCC